MTLKQTAGLSLVGISGSLRRGSFTTALLHAIKPILPEDVAMVEFPLHAIPLYNQDEDPSYGGDIVAPKAVTDLRAAIERCDGMIVISPEYNYGIPGVLKNAIDWASRPGYQSPLKDKPVLAITNSPGPIGGVRAQQQLRDTFAATLSRVVIRPEIVVASVKDKLATGALTDQPTIDFIKQGIADLVAEISERVR